MKPAARATEAAPGAERSGGRTLGASALLVAKPGIVAGVALSGLAGMALAGRGMPDPGHALACLAGILLAASGSAVMNGVLERRSDDGMARLARRADAMRTVGPRRAAALSLVLVAAGLLVAFAFLNARAALLVLAAVLGYTVLYTLFLKRRSPYGTIPGGIPGALPVLIGYAAVNPRLGADAVLLFLLMILWQPPHFWTLALAHKDDYRKAGIPVMPVSLGEPYTKVLIFAYAAALLPLSLALWVFGFCSAYFAAGAAALWIYFLSSCLFHAVRTRRFGAAFASSIVYIVGLLSALILDVALR